MIKWQRARRWLTSSRGRAWCSSLKWCSRARVSRKKITENQCLACLATLMGALGAIEVATWIPTAPCSTGRNINLCKLPSWSLFSNSWLRNALCCYFSQIWNFIDRIDLFTLKNPRLQYLFNSEIDELKKSFLDLQKQTDDQNYKQELMITFFLAIDQKKL